MRYQNITNQRQFRSVTGKTKSEFEDLLKTFVAVHEDIFGKLSAQIGKGKENKLLTYGDCLLFVLYQLKTNLTYDALGATFGMVGSAAHSNFTKYLKVLEIALLREGVYPKRDFESRKEFEEALENENEIIIDGEEQPIQRPKDPDFQKDMYSGKKKCTRTRH